MVKHICILLFFFAAPAFAQPRLDSIWIDESIGELQLFGDFSTLGKLEVLCDSVSLSILHRDQGSIRATIPDRGKGSCGLVNVVVDGDQSNGKLITYWHFHNYYMSDHSFSDGGYEYVTKRDTVFLRGDLLSAWQAGRHLFLRPVALSRYFEEAYGEDGMREYKYRGETYKRSGALNTLFEVHPGTGINDHYAGQGLQFTKAGGLEAYDNGSSCGYPGGGTCQHGEELSRTKFPVASSKIASKRSDSTIQTAIYVNGKLVIHCETEDRLTIFDASGKTYGTWILRAGANTISAKLPIGRYFTNRGLGILVLR